MIPNREPKKKKMMSPIWFKSVSKTFPSGVSDFSISSLIKCNVLVIMALNIGYEGSKADVDRKPKMKCPKVQISTYPFNFHKLLFFHPFLF